MDVRDCLIDTVVAKACLFFLYNNTYCNSESAVPHLVLSCRAFNCCTDNSDEVGSLLLYKMAEGGDTIIPTLPVLDVPLFTYDNIHTTTTIVSVHWDNYMYA